MKVAVTGGTGFLGKEVVSTIKKDGDYTPIIISRGTSFNTNEEVRITDYSTESLRQVFKDVEAVIHLAAIRVAGNSIKDYFPNVMITQNIYEVCSELGIKNIVFASSISVYSDTTKIPWKENQLTQPKNMYGISKMICEQLADVYHFKKGLNVKSLRIAHILGEGERKGYMMNTFIDNAFEKKELKVIGKSIAKREFVYVKDVANAILLALKKDDLHGVFNIGSNVAYTNYEIAKMVNEVFDNEGNLTYDDTSDEGIESSLMDSSKAYEAFGYKPQWSFKDALHDILSIKNQKTVGISNE